MAHGSRRIADFVPRLLNISEAHRYNTSGERPNDDWRHSGIGYGPSGGPGPLASDWQIAADYGRWPMADAVNDSRVNGGLNLWEGSSCRLGWE